MENKRFYKLVCQALSAHTLSPNSKSVNRRESRQSFLTTLNTSDYLTLTLKFFEIVIKTVITKIVRNFYIVKMTNQIRAKTNNRHIDSINISIK